MRCHPLPNLLTFVMQKTALGFGIFLLLAAPMASAVKLEAIEPNCQKVENIPFYFCDGKDFNSESLRLSAKPKSWTSEDINKFDAHLIPLLSSKRLTNFFRKIQDNGMIYLYRYSYGFSGSNGEFFRVPTVMMQANAKNKMLIVTDRYLNYSLKDPLGNFDRADLTMLHELAHAFDGADWQYSTSEEFLRLSGFTKDSGTWKLSGLPQGLDDSLQQYADLLSKGNLHEAFSLSRNISAKFGLSSFAVIPFPWEYLAETTATVYFDPNASTYLNPEIVKWINKNILN